MAKLGFSILFVAFLCLEFAQSTGGNSTKKRRSRNGHQVRDLVCPVTTPLCSVSCADGASWTISLPKNNVEIVFDQPNQIFAYIDGTNAVVTTAGYSAFLQAKAGVITVYNFEFFNWLKPVPTNPDIQEALGLLTIPNRRLEGMIYLKNVLINNIPDDPNKKLTRYSDVLLSTVKNLPSNIAGAFAQLVKNRVRSGINYMDGVKMFMATFSLMSVMDYSNDMYMLFYNDDLSISTNIAGYRFEITETGKTTKLYEVVGSLNLEQTASLPGGYTAAGPTSYIYSFSPTINKSDCVLNNLVNSMGGISSLINPIVALLKRTQPTIFKRL